MTDLWFLPGSREQPSTVTSVCWRKMCTWRGQGFLQDWQTRNKPQLLLPKGRRQCCSRDPSLFPCRNSLFTRQSGEPMQTTLRVKCRTGQTDAGRHHGRILKTSSSNLFGDFCPWHCSKWNLDSCHLLLLLLLAEMQWWMSTQRKSLCVHNYGIQLFCLVWWCQAFSYHTGLTLKWIYVLQKILSR